MVTLRGLRARASQSLALFAMGVLAVAGCVLAVSYSEATHTSTGAAGALLLLGAVAIASQGAASVRSRRAEIALAQLRGRRGVGLLAAAVGEPALILVAAAALGTVSGWLLAKAAVHRWVGSGVAAVTMTASDWATAVAMLLAGALVVVAVSWRTAFEPLAGKLDATDRPRPATPAGTFLAVLVLVGAGVAVYQARSLGAQRADWVSYLSPAVVGLAAGQLAVWSVAIGAGLALRLPRVNRGVGWFLTLRRLTRRDNTASALRIVVAAVVVAGLAGSGWFGSSGWRDQTARVDIGGPLAFDVPAGGLAAYLASHDVDPQGRWLMAIVASPQPSGRSSRDAFVDTGRWNRVVGSFYADTPVGGVTGQIGALSPASVVQYATGDRVSVRLTAGSVRRAWPRALLRRVSGFTPYDFAALRFTIGYVDGRGDQHQLRLPEGQTDYPDPVRAGVVGYTAHAPACARRCAVTSVSVQGKTEHPLRVTEMSFGDLRLIPAGPGGPSAAADTRAVRSEVSGNGLALSLTDPNHARQLLEWRPEAAPVLTTPGLRLAHSHGQPVAHGVDGAPHPVRVAGQVAALPVLGRAGLLLDLGEALRGAGAQIPQSQTSILARADTPASVVDRLRATGIVEAERTYPQALAAVERSTAAEGTRLFAIVAVFGLLIAAVSTASGVLEQRRLRRDEAASLRVVGVGTGVVATAYRREAFALGAGVAVVGGLMLWLACRLLLGVLPLVHPGEFGLLFDAAPPLTIVAGLAVAAGAFVALTVYLGLSAVARTSPPSLLREDR